MSSRLARLSLLVSFVVMLLALSASPVLGAETTLVAELSGSEEVPGPGDPEGSGFSEITVDPDAGTVCYFIDVDTASVVLPATAAHIHRAAVGVAGPIVVTLTPPDASGSADGCVDADAALLQSIVDDPAGFYVNVHNADYPDGAVRGQLAAPLPQLFASLTGAAEVPGPGDPDGSGFSVLHDIDVPGGTICYFIEAAAIEIATAAHVHQAVAGVAGPIVIPLTPPDATGFVDDCTTADTALLQAILDDPAGFYVNVHTPTYPAGAVRGQLGTEPPPSEDCVPPAVCDFGTMPPGTYVYGGFPASLSFTTTEAWHGRLFPDGLGLESLDVPAALYIMTFNGAVFDLPCGEAPATTESTPQAFVDWIAAHPSLDAGAPSAMSVGGAPGIAIDITGALPPGCSDGTLSLFGVPEDPFFVVDAERVRFVAVDVLGTTVVFIIDVFEPTDDFDAFLARAQGVLDSMIFALPAAATSTPTPGASAVASALPNTAAPTSTEALSLGPLELSLAILLLVSACVVLKRRVS